MASLRTDFSFRRHLPSWSYAEDFLKIETSGIVYPSNSYEHSINNESNRFLFEYIVSGKGYIDYENTRTPVSAGDFVIIRFSNQLRYFSDRDEPYSKIWFTATGKFPKSLMQTFDFTDTITIIKQNMYSHFESFIAFIDSPEFSHSKAAVKFLELMLYAVGEDFSAKPNALPLHEQVKVYLEVNFKSKITMQQLAYRFNKSEKKIYSDFVSAYGMSPNKYISKLRLDTAKKALENSSATVAELASSLNYSSASHLSKDFFKEFGVYPTEYRKQFKAD